MDRLVAVELGGLGFVVDLSIRFAGRCRVGEDVGEERLLVRSRVGNVRIHVPGAAAGG